MFASLIALAIYVVSDVAASLPFVPPAFTTLIALRLSFEVGATPWWTVSGVFTLLWILGVGGFKSYGRWRRYTTPAAMKPLPTYCGLTRNGRPH